jgi:hypothetical protein
LAFSLQLFKDGLNLCVLLGLLSTRDGLLKLFIDDCLLPLKVSQPFLLLGNFGFEGYRGNARKGPEKIASPYFVREYQVISPE